jgi:hypothetical protein
MMCNIGMITAPGQPHRVLDVFVDEAMTTAPGQLHRVLDVVAPGLHRTAMIHELRRDLPEGHIVIPSLPLDNLFFVCVFPVAGSITS